MGISLLCLRYVGKGALMPKIIDRIILCHSLVMCLPLFACNATRCALCVVFATLMRMARASKFK